MLGFHFPLNFDYPYISRSITEFWRRWHISLGTWFREYVYIPLGGNRRGTGIQIRNILIVWMLTGIWHGASWNFLLWGLYFGVLLILEKCFLLPRLQKAPRIVSWLYTVFLVLISWVIFASVDGAGGIGYLAAMFGGNQAAGVGLADGTAWYLFRNYGVLLLLCAVGATPFVHRMTRGPRRSEAAGWRLAQSAAGLLILFICTAYLVDATYNPFLYFRF